MSKKEELKATYLKDLESMAAKSRFGYFSILPNPQAGYSSPERSSLPRDQHGRLPTQPRNVFSGITASGVLKKTFFHFETSVYQGDPYSDPGKKEKASRLEETKNLNGKDVYRPLDLVKTPSPKAAYEHIPEKPVHKTAKDFKDENGKVITSSRNVMTSSATNIEKQRQKQLTYIPDPYENHIKVSREEAKKSRELRGQAPFKQGSPVKRQFYTSRQTYGSDENCKPKMVRKQKSHPTGAEHDSSFKPSCSIKYDTFSYPEYMAGGQKPKAKSSRCDDSKEKFKVRSSFENSKPTPSISTFKSNILRGLR